MMEIGYARTAKGRVLHTVEVKDGWNQSFPRVSRALCGYKPRYWYTPQKWRIEGYPSCLGCQQSEQLHSDVPADHD